MNTDTKHRHKITEEKKGIIRLFQRGNHQNIRVIMQEAWIFRAFFVPCLGLPSATAIRFINFSIMRLDTS